MERWYVVQTNVRQEQIALENLSRQGYQCFYPRIKQWHKRRGKRYLSEEAFFPGYLFISLDLDQTNTTPIRSTRGVTSLIRFGYQIQPVPEAVIEILQQRTDSMDVVSVLPVDFKPGQQVRIEEGPLEGFTAIFQTKKGEDRAILLLGLLGSQRRVEVPSRSLCEIS
jgi:transcriptional antiterminator RfaH